MRCHRISCQEPWFSMLRDQRKPVEGRKNSPAYQKIQVGDLINFFWRDSNFTARVVTINKYLTLKNYLEAETLERALPGINSIEEGLAIYKQWNSDEEIAKYGFLGIQIQVLDL